MNQPVNLKLKICLLGDIAVGKTSLVRRSVRNKFNENYHPTIGSMTYRKNITIKRPDLHSDFNLELTIWDITGQISFKKLLHPHYLRGAKGAILMCDLTKRETLDNLHEWLDSVSSVCKKVPSVFIANKSDCTDNFEFSASEIESTASEFNSPFLTTSAKSGDNIENVFRILGNEIINDWVNIDV